MAEIDDPIDFPKVSIVTPVLNGVATIADCLDSVASQDYPHIEHLVVDGASTDGTLAILHQYNVDFTSERDLGLYDAMNKGISRASGHIIGVLNADDMYAGPKVVKRMATFMTRNNLDIGHGRVNQIDATGRSIRIIGYDVTKEKLLKKCKVAHPSVFVTRSVYDKFGVYCVQFSIAADHEFFLRVWDKVNIGFLPEFITTMRLGGRSNSLVQLSYTESMAASLLHGADPSKALVNYHYELTKSAVLRILSKLSGKV